MPAQTLGSLVVELGIDPSNFNKGEQDALNRLRNFQSEATKSGTTIESQQKRIGNMMLDFRREALTTLGVFLGGRGIEDFSKYIVRTDIAVGNLSKTLKMSSTDINAWMAAIQKSGGNPQDAVSGLSGTTAALQNAIATGNWSAFAASGRIVNARDVKDAGDLWLKVADHFKDIAKTPEGAAFAAQQMSLIPGDNPGLTNFALRGGAFMRQNIALAASQFPITPDDVDNANKLNAAWLNLENTAKGLGQQIQTTLTPALTDVLDKMDDLAQKHPDAATALGIGGGAAAVTAGVPFLKWLFGGGALRAAGVGIGSLFGVAGIAATGGLLASTVPAGAGEEEALRKALGARSWAGGLDTSAFAPAGGDNAAYAARIRSYAASLGLDPSQIFGISQKEGFGRSGTWWDVNGPSGGDFSLHKGPGGGAVGDLYEKATGHKIGDPRYRWEEDKFAIDYMNKHGAGAWSTWRGGPLARGPGAATAAARGGVAMPGGSSGASGKSVSVTIGTMQINAPQAKDAQGIAQAVGPQLTRTLNASLGNGGGT